MRKQLSLLLFVFLMYPGLASAIGVPTNITFTNITQTSITVNWVGVSGADAYNVYWGTSSSTLNNTYQVSSTTRLYAIPNLVQNTTYYVQVSAFSSTSGEGSRSVVQSATTLKDTSVPSVPTGFTVTSPDSITDTSATFMWNKNSETNFDHYNIYYGTVSGSLGSSPVQATNDNANSFPITGLTSATRYYFAISAINSAGNESATSKELIVDTLVDTLPPFVPSGFSAKLSGQNEITVSMSDGNSQMADYAGNIVYYGTTSGVYNQSVDIGKNLFYVFDNLPEGSTWYYTALAYDIHGNQSAKTTEITAKVEATVSFLGQSDKFDGGCFIGTSRQSSFSTFPLFILMLIIFVCYAIPKKFRIVIGVTLFILITDYHAFAVEPQQIKNNLIGISAGYFMPSESNFNDFYNNSSFPVFGFYERRIYKFITADIEAGYLKKNGNLLTVSGASTAIGSEITVVPVSASLKIEKEIFPFITGYIGIGPDYWFCREKTDAQTENNEIKEWVGGYHGKLGFKLHNMDETYRNTGAIVECVYSRIDRFGENDLDIGGLTVKFGFFYQF